MQTVLESGDIRVLYPSGCMWTMNPDTVVKVRVSWFVELTTHILQ